MQLYLSLRRLGLVLSILWLACKKDAPMTQGEAPTASAQEQASSAFEYPRARWRRSDPAELEHVVLWVSQILVRHEGAELSPPFAVTDWRPDSPGARRTRAEALALANELRRQANEDPAHFGELAARHSEDVATRSLAGSLGGISASQFLLWPTVLDALEQLPVGKVSEVVETEYGFHILLRRPPPPEHTVTGAHIVIAYDAAGWIQILGRSEAPRRSRADALALADQLYETAREKPGEFPELIERFSDHRDAERGGDMGTWSTREPTFYPREVELLARLAVGDVAPPVDSHVGFQVIQRTPNRQRERFAMDEIRMFFDPARAAPDPSSRASVWEKANQLSLELRAAPARFYELRAKVCCSYSEQWAEGRGSPSVTAALSRLQIGQLTAEPIQSEHSYVIARRIEPTRTAPVVRFELP